MDARHRHKIAKSMAGVSAVLSGVLLGSCYPPLDCGYLAWIALAPLGLGITSKGLDRGAWCGVYAGGLIYHLMSLEWMRTAYGGESMFGPYATGWAAAGHAATVIFLVVFMVSRKVIVHYSLPLCVGLPLFWGALDTTRKVVSECFGGEAIPWFSLGVTQVDRTSIIQVADLGGEGLIGLLIAGANGLLFDLLRQIVGKGWSGQLTGWRLASPACVAAFLLAAFAYSKLREGQEPATDGPVIQLVGKHETLLKPTPTDPTVDLVIWPELSANPRILTQCDSSVGDPLGVAAGREQLRQAAASRGASLLVGCERVDYQPENPRYYNSLILASIGTERVEW
ncbi:MAG: hypothetical protein AAF266_05825 [Planctomycetota bacterium]